ncbi:transcriptional regulator [Actinoplanes sp. GCM10030250]|uniref:transcriptional regulator n=1 Tax=Actinoplanes sp. GCM10030250 TaxID=3273376 RepID=UPI003607517F
MSDTTVLHTLRCIGYAELARLAGISELPEDETESHLIDLAVDGFVHRTPPPFPTWGLTEAGKAEDARRITAELEDAGARTAVTSAYDRFMVLNPELLDLCSAALDDHADAARDARVLARFVNLDERAGPVCADLGAALPRFNRYRVRLTSALDQAKSGSRDHLATTTDSYHGVWFQLHEDLLATLGIPR